MTAPTTSTGAVPQGEGSAAPVDITTPSPEVIRDRYGRPMVLPPKGEKPTAYQRCTTFAGLLDETYNLSRWQMRMVALGLVDRDDLLLAVAAHRDDKSRLNDLCNDALEAAKAHAAATTGTALHALTEQHDRGTLDMAKVPATYRPDIQAYIDRTAHLRMVQIETFGVCDDLKVAGTWDRIVATGGRCYIADIKTGGVDFAMGKIAIQLAIYAHCQRYDLTTKTRVALPPVDQDRAIVIHLPAGTGTCELLSVDIAAGWRAVELATGVKAWRARKDLSQPWTDVPDVIAAEIAATTTVDALAKVWERHRADWTDALSEIARAHKHTLQPAA